MSKKQMIRRRGLSAFLAMAMCFGLLPATAWAAEEGVAIDESNFPNKTFRNYIQKVFDKDNNDFFSADEIAAVTELTFQYPDDPNTGVAGITSLKGIEYFTALTSLDCSYQDLTELDLSRNTGLTSVLCYGNQLTELDLSANTQLIELDCSSNEITHLDVSSNHNLEKLSCYHNRLTSLDLSRNNKLTYTYCDSWCPIEPDENNTINLAELDVDKTSDWVGGKVENGILTIDEGAKKVTYNYQCGNNIEMHVILHIHIYDDSWEYNANEHWKKCTNFCTGAHQGMIKSPHDYKGGNTCSICGYVNAADTYAVTVEVDGHGTAGASPAFAKTDETVTLTAIPDTGYAFKTWEVIRGGVAITNDTFIMPAKPVTVKAVFQEKTAAPVISPNGGSFNDTETVTLTCDTEGAWIYYTINGVKSHYMDPFTLTESANITAWAEKMGKADSDIVTAAFIKIVDGVAVDTFNFPDKNFRDVVKTFDTDDNNILSDTEIAAVKEIDCKGRAITNLKGIEYFTALEYLYCYDNELTELDLKRNTKLKELNCSTNRLTVLDLSQNPKLKRVICSNNALTALNLSSNSKLTNLNASGNIREIALTGNTFDLSSLTGFDVSKARNWQGGTVSGNTLTVDGNAAVVIYSYDISYTGTELDDEEKDVIFTLAIAGRGTEIAINETNFPDKDFREFLLDKEANIDRNQDGKLSTGEIALVQDIDVYDMEIADLTGIEYFTELKYLDCAGNHLTSLDLSRNTKLAELDADNNTYTITPVNDRFYLASLPAGFDVAKTSHWQGGTVSGNVLTIDSDVDEVTYDYDCGKDFTTTFTLKIPTQYTVTAHGLYGGVMGITPGEDYTARYTVGAQVGLQIGKRNGFTLQGLTLEGISEEQLQWQAKDAESTTRGISFEMPAHNVTVTVNWKANGSSSGGGSSGGGGGGTSTPGYDVSADKTENGTVTVSPKSASKGDSVTITAAPDKGYELSGIKVIDQNGREVKLTDKGSGKYTFTMPAGKVTIKADFTAQTADSVFADVSADAYYYEAVKWAADKGITGGIGDSLFAPNQSCTRAQIVTFLWRAAGSPEPKALSSFADVPADAHYAKAVAWAVENGITNGTTDTTFGPDETCTRAHGVTFLSRAAKANTASGNSNFADVDANAYYASAVKWAVDNGITNGISSSLFGPDSSCTRAQIVTFLYRMYQGK
jgi:Leucine-rich repeat (LRR) protein